jgi:phytoene dehydrogenase-like protein
MIRHTYMKKTGEFASREVQIHRDLTAAVAARDGLRLDHPRSKFTAESTADDLLKQWPRLRRDPETDIERLCQDNLDNEQAWAEYRRKLQAERDAMRAANAPPAPDPNFVTLYVRDDLSRKLYKVTLPASSVEAV